MKIINKTEEYMLYYEQFLSLRDQGKLKEGSVYHILDLPDGLDLVEGNWTVKKAECDAEGNIIHETYVKRLDLDYQIVDSLPTEASIGKMIYLNELKEPLDYSLADMIQVEDSNVTMNVSSQEFWDAIYGGSYIDGLGYYSEVDEESSRRFYEIYCYVTNIENVAQYESVILKFKTDLWERELILPFLVKENNVISYVLDDGSESQGELTFLIDNNVLFTRLLLITDQVDLPDYFRLESITSNSDDVIYNNTGSEFNLSNLKISNGSEYASFIPTKASDLENDIHFATEDYVEQNGGKIDRILLNEVEQEIVDKAVNLTIDKTVIGLSNADNTSDMDKPISTATQTALNAITEKIPNQASVTNQLADKDFVNSSINSYAATFKGSYATKAALDAIEWQTEDATQSTYVTNNDYVYIEADETKNNEAWRYLYVKDETTSEWQPQFKVNDTPFTAEQLAAINSGITSDYVSARNEATISINGFSHTVFSPNITAANIFAPTTAGTNGYVLKSNGSNTTPTWTTPSIQEISSQYIRITSLETGTYKLTYNGTKNIYYYGSTSNNYFSVGASTVTLHVHKYVGSGTYWHWYYINGTTGWPSIVYGYMSISSGNYSSKGLNALLANGTTSSVTSGSTGLLTSGGAYTNTSRVTLNGTSMREPSFYAPTSAGTAGQVLVSTGDDLEPVWTDLEVSGGGSSNVALVTSPVGSEVIQDTETSQQINVMTRDTDQTVNSVKNFTKLQKITTNGRTLEFGAMNGSGIHFYDQSGLSDGFFCFNKQIIANVNDTISLGNDGNRFTHAYLSRSVAINNWTIKQETDGSLSFTV